MTASLRRNPAAPTAFVVCGVIAALLNGWFQSTVAQRFSEDDAGAASSLAVVLGGLGLVGLGAQVLVARAGRRPARSLLVLGLTAATLAGASWLATPGAAWYRAWVAVLMGLAGAIVLLGVPPRAALLRDRRWIELGVAYVFGAMARAAAVPLTDAAIDSGLLAALVAGVVGEGAVVAAAALLARRSRCAPIAATSSGAAAPSRELLGPVIALLGLWVITIADGVVARLRLPPDQADAYAVASSTSRVGFFLALLITHLALPALINDRNRSTSLHRVVNRTYAVIAATEAAVVVVVMLWPAAVAARLAPTSGISVEPTTVRILVVAWALLGVVPLATYSHLARPSRLSFAPLAAAAVVVLVGPTRTTATGLAWVLVAVVSATAAITVMVGLLRIRPITRAARWQGTPTERSEATDTIAVVVPFFNPGPDTMVRTVTELDRSLCRNFREHRIIAVSDGSTDGSYEALVALNLPTLIATALPANRGKGAAIRHGLALAHEPLVAYIDADGDLPPHQVALYASILRDADADAVVASKLHPGSTLAVEPHRAALSWLFRLAVRTAFRLDVADTQTGLKVFRQAVVGPVLPLLCEDGFAIDVEILVAAHARTSLSIIEAPVVIQRQSGSTVSLVRSLDTVAGLGRILWRQRVVLTYSVDDEPTR
jgi:dolichol-phosphate mannosyltransferase